MECECTGYMINGIVYGVSASVIAYIVIYLIIDAVRERG